jgi:thiamine biosynthesis lipoprotein
MKKIFFRTILPLSIVLLTSYFYFSKIGAQTPAPLLEKKFMLDTVVSLQIYGDGKRSNRVADKVFDEMRRIENIGDVHKNNSEITKINRNVWSRPRFYSTEAMKEEFEKIKISKELLEMIGLSLKYSELTNGAFNPVLGSIIDLWGIGGKNYLPTDDQIKKAFSFTRADNIKIEGGALKFKPQSGIQFDLGGVLKGYAVDKAARLAENNGIVSALISTVSSTRTIGLKPGNEPWRIGVENPRKGKGPDVIGVLKLGSGFSVSTSGDYQRYFIKAGKRYSHIIDPSTGYSSNGCMSVTIVTKRSAAEADILSTAVFVMGYPKGMRFVNKTKDVQALIVDNKGAVHISKGMNRLTEKIAETIYSK